MSINSRPFSCKPFHFLVGKMVLENFHGSTIATPPPSKNSRGFTQGIESFEGYSNHEIHQTFTTQVLFRVLCNPGPHPCHTSSKKNKRDKELINIHHKKNTNYFVFPKMCEMLVHSTPIGPLYRRVVHFTSPQPEKNTTHLQRSPHQSCPDPEAAPVLSWSLW